MKFSGHETFPIREGWLHKGLKLLAENPDLLVHEYAADYLGVGRNMAKSIRHWLVVTGLADYEPGKAHILKKTDFGDLVWDKDPYFLETGTWWSLHVNLACGPNHPGTWFWFFNHFSLDRFEKSVCFEAQKRYLEISSHRVPSLNTLDRDLSCMLASYSRQTPPRQQDPEDASNCPFQDLGFLVHYKSSGYYEIDRGLKNIPSHILGYVISSVFEEAQLGEGAIDISFQNMAMAVRGPGRVLALTNESLFELARRAEEELPQGDMYIAGLAGERMLRIQRKSPLTWIKEYYQVTSEMTENAS